jgi:hypothetical protein
MKLKDVKHIIDAYFDALEPLELVRHLESLGYEFEPIEDYSFPHVADFSEVSDNNRFEHTFEGQIELGVSYLNKEFSQQTALTDYDDYQVAMAA